MAVMKVLEHFHQSCSAGAGSKDGGLFGFGLRFASGFFKPAPSPKPRPKPKILAAQHYIFSVNALTVGLVLLTTSLMAAEPSKQDLIKEDMNEIQGTWKVVALEAGGEAAPSEIVAALKLVFKDDTLTFTPGEPGFTNYKFKLDPAAKPAGFAMTHADGGSRNETEKGIYLPNGDQLKICFGAGGKVPGEFTARAKSGQSMYTLARVK
jgi:uncharacterized protein (TIGR03067 family)